MKTVVTYVRISPQVHVLGHLVPSWWHYLRGLRRYGLARGSMPLKGRGL